MSVSRSVEPAVAVAAPAPSRNRPAWTAARIASVAAGTVIGLASLTVLSAGGWATWATTTQRDAAGYITASTHTIASTGSAITSGEVGELPDRAWGGLLGNVRVRATSTDPNAGVFIGVAPTAAVDRYLTGVDRTAVTGWFPVATQNVPGTAAVRPPAPAGAGIWTDQVSGTGTQALTWRPAGATTVVVMHPDGSAAVSAVIDVGAKAPDLALLAVICFIVGGLMLCAGAVLIVSPIRRARR